MEQTQERTMTIKIEVTGEPAKIRKWFREAMRYTDYSKSTVDGVVYSVDLDLDWVEPEKR